MNGSDRPIRDSFHQIKGVAAADVVTGHYDIAAVLESEAMPDIFNDILKKVRAIKGISRTEAFVAVE